MVIKYIERVIAVYFETYSHHYYTKKAITNLNNISYIFLYIYISIYHLFNNLIIEEYNLITYHFASNIFYYIRLSNILIKENILKLLDDKKKYYFDNFG